ncbi:hypothetical protein [Streptomyces sp. NPDC002537]
MSTHPIESPPAPPAAFAAKRDNERAVEALLGYTNLPAPVVIARPDAVYVSVTGIDDLGKWLAELGGEICISPTWQGVRLWTLLTATPARADGSSVAVRVSAALPAAEAGLRNAPVAVAW